jgi:PilZ domain
LTKPERKAASDEAGSENRRYPRLCCGGIANLRVIPSGGKETGSLINLSKRGCCFLADDPLRGVEGSTIEVHLKIRGIDIRVAGVIRHVHKGIRAGIEFVGLSSRKCVQIDELIAELVALDQHAEKIRQAALRKHDEENLVREERRQAQEQRQDLVRKRLLRFYRR